MRTLRYNFPNAQGQTLAARLDLPADGRPAAYALFSHCFTGSKNWNVVRDISRELILEDIAVFRFDFTGLGDSDGDFAETNFSTNISDLMAATDFMVSHDMSPSLLIGHSLGGAAALAAGSQISSIQAIATIAAPSDPEHVKHQFESHLSEIQHEGSAKVSLGGRPFQITQQFVDDLAQQDLNSTISDLNRALLIMHSPQDLTVSIDHAAILYQQAKHPKSFVSLDGAEHLLMDEADARYAGRVIASWAARYIDRNEDVLPTPDHGSVAVQSQGEYFADIKANKFRMATDASKREGGKGLAPTPEDFLFSAIGGSINMHIQRFAEDKDIKLEGVCSHIGWKDKEGEAIQANIEVWGDLKDRCLEEMKQRLNYIPSAHWTNFPIHTSITKKEL